MVKYTTEQIGFAIKCRNEGLSWDKVAQKMTEAGFPKRSGANVRATIIRVQKEYDVKVAENVSHWKNDPATRKQCKYISDLTLKNGTRNELDRLTNQLVNSANKGDFTKEQAMEMIATLEGSMKNTKRTVSKEKKKSKSKNTRKKYTKRQNEMISNCKTAKEAENLSLTLNRTPSALNRQWYVLREKETARAGWNVKQKKQKSDTNQNRWTSDEDDIVIEWKTTKGEYPPVTLFKNRTYKAIVARWNRVLRYRNNLTDARTDYVNNHKKEEKPITMGIATVAYPNTNKAWTYDESLEAMVMWHSLPIDEAREKFGRPYWVIAKHVEKHYDFYYDTSETIMRRATEIKNNMKNQSLPVKKSLLQRWKDRRSDRKSKKLQKKIDRTKKKLKKMEVKQ